MKKYAQITAVVVVFGLLVIAKRMWPEDSAPVSITASPTPSATPTTSATPVAQTTGIYKDGSYTGSVEDAQYGNMQVSISVSNGKLADISFLQFPNDNGTSRAINNQALPILRSEAIQAQSSKIDIVSGASSSSPAFQRSLEHALQQAHK